MADSALSRPAVSSQVPAYMIDQFLPGFSFLSKFYANYLGVDLSAAFAWLFLAYASGNALGYAWGHIKNFFTRWFTSSIVIPVTDRLHRYVLQWISVHVVKENSRFMTAQSSKSPHDINNEDILRMRMGKRPKLVVEPLPDQKSSVQFYPSFGGEWFFFKGRLIVMQRTSSNVGATGAVNPMNVYRQGEGNEPLVLVTPGLSPAPLKAFLKACEDFANRSNETMTRIFTVNRHYGNSGWDTALMRPSRPIDTVDLDEHDKMSLINDIDEYLKPAAQRFYARRGIPYRRGYLFHGAPGTGKTSLSVALAGRFNLELYTLSLTNSWVNDMSLADLFASLPARCIVLLEDIDVAGMSREARAQKAAEKAAQKAEAINTGVTDREKRKIMRSLESYEDDPAITLSGLLNAIDGVSSQEGRVLIMTTNDPEALDKALIRPGRVDMQIHFKFISQLNSAQVFLRFYKGDDGPDSTEAANDSTGTEKEVAERPLVFHGVNYTTEEIKKMSEEFASKIPEAVLTPAEVQGFLLMHKVDPVAALATVTEWVDELLAAKAENKNIIKPDEALKLAIKQASSSSSSEDEASAKKPKNSAKAVQRRLDAMRKAFHQPPPPAPFRGVHFPPGMARRGGRAPSSGNVPASFTPQTQQNKSEISPQVIDALTTILSATTAGDGVSADPGDDAGRSTNSSKQASEGEEEAKLGGAEILQLFRDRGIAVPDEIQAMIDSKTPPSEEIEKASAEEDVKASTETGETEEKSADASTAEHGVKQVGAS